MVNVKKLVGLTAEEIQIAAELNELRKTAEEMETLIRKAYKFGIGEECICVWNDERNAEHLTHAGEWKARYLYKEYNVTCTEKEILRLLVADYIVSNGLHEDCSTEDKNEFESAAKVFGYFRAFIERTKKEHPELCHASEDT